MRITMRVARVLAQLARDGDPRAAPLLAAFRRFSEVPISEIRFANLERALTAYGAPIQTLLGGP